MWGHLRLSSRAQVCFAGLNPCRGGANFTSVPILIPEVLPSHPSSPCPVATEVNSKAEYMRLLCLALGVWSQQKPWLPTNASHLPSPLQI